jgi:hypothetical protein
MKRRMPINSWIRLNLLVNILNEEALAMDDSLFDDDTWLLILNNQDTIFEKRVKNSFPNICAIKK